jgi:hypothetical protein
MFPMMWFSCGNRRCASLTGSIYCLLMSAILCAACDKLSDPGNEKNVGHITPAGWQTVCLDRFLIDLPAPIDMGATKAEYHRVYGFGGINDLGGKGLRWGKVRIQESVPTSEEGYGDVREGAGSVISSPEQFLAAFRSREEEVRHWTKRVHDAPPGEIASAKEMLADAERELRESHYGLKVTGKAKIAEVYAFAYRSGNDFSLGYLDSVDRRVRMFEGKISHLDVQSPEAPASEFRRFQQIFHRRMPTDIPTAPGYCTAHGFIDEATQTERDTTMEIPFRSSKYPNLIFHLTVAPADAVAGKSMQSLPNMNADKADLHLVGITKRYGPLAEKMLGTPGRSVGYEYGPNCSKTSCRPPDQAYEMEAETFGTPGRPDQPNLILHMIAATSDDYKLKLPAVPGNDSYNKPSRPSLSGHVPPPFEEGKKIFEQVLRSIRLRPGAITSPVMRAPGIAASQDAKA